LRGAQEESVLGKKSGRVAGSGGSHAGVGASTLAEKEWFMP